MQQNNTREGRNIYICIFLTILSCIYYFYTYLCNVKFLSHQIFFLNCIITREAREIFYRKISNLVV